MTSPSPARAQDDYDGQSNSRNIHRQNSLTLFRAPRPYHRRGDSLIKASTLSSPAGDNASPVSGGSRQSPLPISRSESSESGTEADDEKGPFLKTLPPAPIHARKGLRGKSPDLTPAITPVPTPPAYVETDRYGYFASGRPGDKRNVRPAEQDEGYREYRRRRRREVVRRCTETCLLWSIAAIVWTSRGGSASFHAWLDELTAFLILPALFYSLYPIRLALRALNSGKSWWPALRYGFHVPSRFDSGPLLYPVFLPLMIAISLSNGYPEFLPTTIACGLSSMPPASTVSRSAPQVGQYLHWLVTILPLNASTFGGFSGSSMPLTLKLGETSPLAREDLALLFPLHQALMKVLDYLTTTSLDISELRLLSTGLIHLFLFARSPQAEILKALLWVGGLCVFVSCMKVMSWEVALARIPTWRLIRNRKQKGWVSKIDHALCSLLVHRRFEKPLQNYDSDSDHGPPKPLSKRRPPLMLQMNGKSTTMPIDVPIDAPISVYDSRRMVAPPIDEMPPFAPRRNTFTAFERNGKNPSSTSKKPKSYATAQNSSFLSLSVEQARVRKWAYAAIAYLAVIMTILGPVRYYVGTRALSGHEPFGWAIGYLLGNIPEFRFWVVSNNLERWISIPVLQEADGRSAPLGLAEYVRQHVVGPANTRLLICGYCVAVLMVGIFAVLRLTSVVEVDTRRKVFHGIMVAMLLPTIFVDPCFTALALSLILAIFLLLDLFRASQLPPVSRPLTTFLAPYVDGRDHRGPVIVSHIFLLIGCAIPLWLALAGAGRTGTDPWIGWDTPVRDLSMVSGVICVGMGDAAASLIGRRYGKTKWYWAGGKSLEGSIAFMLAVTCGLTAGWVWLRLGGWKAWNDGSFTTAVGKSMIAGAGASLLESTLTAANDNVVVPVGLWLLVRGLQL